VGSAGAVGQARTMSSVLAMARRAMPACIRPTVRTLIISTYRTYSAASEIRMRHAVRRFGLRTARIRPLLPPPQKN
jgi:hypothetical protein